MTVFPLSDPTRNGTTPPSGCAAAAADEFWFLRWLVRLRWVFFILVLAVLLSGHNGRWRVGRDSALYREVAHNLAIGRGYTFRGEPQRHVYPGLPAGLAVIEKLIGREDGLRPQVTLLVMLGTALLTLSCIYRLLLEHFPRWLAVCVTTGVGLSYEFNQHAHEIMTDMPFLLGVCMTLLGLARVRRTSGRAKAWAIFLFLTGAVLACSMRPTFWLLVAAGLGAAVLEGVRSGNWRWPVVVFGLLLGFTLLWSAVDPRGGPLQGKYEQILRERLSSLGEVDWPARLQKVTAETLPEAIFGFEMPWWMGPIFAGLILGSAIRRIRRMPIWGLYVVATFTLLVVVGSNARYLLMVLPMLLAEWALMVHALARWLIPLIPWRFTPDWVMLFGLGTATVIQVALTGNLAAEQHGYDRNQHFEQRAFLEVYRGGKMSPVVALASAIRQRVPESAHVLGPEARITTFLSGRRVYDASDVFGRKPVKAWPAAAGKLAIDYIAWGPQFTRERATIKSLRLRILCIELGKCWTVVPDGPGARGKLEGVYLGKVFHGAVRVRRPTTRPAIRPATRPVSRPAAAATRPARNPGAKAGIPRPNPVRTLPGLAMPPQSPVDRSNRD